MMVVEEDSGGEIFMCCLCDSKYFKLKDVAVDHIIDEHNLMHSDCKLYLCTFDPACKFKTYQTSRIRLHMLNDHTAETRAFHCKQCNLELESPQMLKAHISQEHPKLAMKMTMSHLRCAECGHLSRSGQAHRAHVATHKPAEERRDFACQQCDQKFVQPVHLDVHIRVVHLKIKQYRCKPCDHAFSNTGNLEEHIAVKHMGYKNGKEWRVAKKDNRVKQSAKEHEAYEYIPHWKDPDKPWTKPITKSKRLL